MKVAYVNQPWDISSPPAGGSLALWSYHVARRFAREAGNEVVIYEKPRPGAPQEETIEGVTYVRVPAQVADRVWNGILRRTDRFRPPDRASFGHAKYCCAYASWIGRDLQRRGCEIVSIHNFSQFIRPIRAKNPSAQIVLHMNCDWLFQLNAKMLESRLAACDVIMGCSEHVSNGARSRYPHHAHKCRTVFNGVDTDWFVPAANGQAQKRTEKRILFCGRGSPEKGIHDLLDCFATVAEADPDVRLEVLGHVASAPREYMVAISADKHVRDLDRFYGNGADYGSALQKRMTPAVAQRTKFTNSLPQKEVAERVRHADVLVMPSLTESFGMPLAEAMASGVATVGTRIGGIPELIDDGVTGLLVDPANPVSLAAALKRVLADAAMRREMGVRGRERAQRLFSWDRVVDALKVCYAEALARPANG